MPRKKKTVKDDDERDFLLPLPGGGGWKVYPPPKNFTIADEATLSNILTEKTRPEPEFKGKDYVRGIKNEEKREFQCNEPNCSARFTNSTSLAIHATKHLNRQIRCSFCNWTFKTEEDMSNHVAEFHPDLEKAAEGNPLQCKKCRKVTRDKKALWRHIRDSHRTERYPCPHCSFPFSHPDALKEHLKYKHLPDNVPVKTYECEICLKVYSHKNTLSYHIRTNHRGLQEPIICRICNKTYNVKASYQQHMRRHIDPKFYPCQVCNKTFRSANHLQRHVDGLAHKKLARKLKLGRKFTAKEVSEKNRETKPNPEIISKVPGSFTTEELIEICMKSVPKIILHRVDHMKVKNTAATNLVCVTEDHHLNCLLCEKPLPDLESLKAHEKLCLFKKQNKKLNICPQCNKEFVNNYQLKRHIKLHSDERPYSCSYCDSSFKTQSTKIQHEKAVHFGIRYKPLIERIYSCNYDGCSKQYKAPKPLKRHIASVHLKIRHSCETCGISFTRKEQLHKHQKVHHDNNPTRLLLCRCCKRTYRSKESLIKHFTTPRHQRKAKELALMFGNKDEMTEVLSGNF